MTELVPGDVVLIRACVQAVMPDGSMLLHFGKASAWANPDDIVAVLPRSDDAAPPDLAAAQRDLPGFRLARWHSTAFVAHGHFGLSLLEPKPAAVRNLLLPLPDAVGLVAAATQVLAALGTPNTSGDTS